MLLAGAVLDGGTLGFRAARVEIAVWVVGGCQNTPTSTAHPDRPWFNGGCRPPGIQTLAESGRGSMPASWCCKDGDADLLAIFPAAPVPVDVKFRCADFACASRLVVCDEYRSDHHPAARDEGTAVHRAARVFRPPRPVA